jgi:hypothetical protein
MLEIGDFIAREILIFALPMQTSAILVTNKDY